MRVPGPGVSILRRYVGQIRLVGILALVFAAGFVTARIWPSQTVATRLISGTVIWSNADIGRILLEGEDSADSGEYEVAAIGRLYRTGEDPPGRPTCLEVTGTESVRTDRRRVELEVVSVNVSGPNDTTEIAVIVRCLG
ncbi:hypothetical protein [Actinoplanes sichuanensis]|uniref:Uncharacterized protein n=1 Tax=Actinoplanes sichuanensis TaxID=512349 RepID=A0ABW4A4N1_9ACTN|nr:hypothetical protein [Actinoplanes sichuanensis]